VRLGAFLEHDFGTDVEAAPLLSLPETAPVVAKLLDGVDGILLDAGCGPNPAVGIALALRPGTTVVGLDIALGTVRLAVARARHASTRLLGVVGDLEALPFRSDAFEGGVCDDTIEHVPDDDRAASELARIVRPGGRMVIATPNRWRLGVCRRKLHDRIRGRRRPDAAYYLTESHLREYSWRQLTQVLTKYAVVTRRASVGWSGSVTRWVATRLVSIPGPRWFSRMVVVEVEPRR
jgi:SAM-dependent methyltransferase